MKMSRRIAVRIARATRKTGGTVETVERDNIGFDLLSTLGLERRCIEVKGRAGIGSVELTWGEYAKATELGRDYWLYVVLDCSSHTPASIASKTLSEPRRRLAPEPRRELRRRARPVIDA